MLASVVALMMSSVWVLASIVSLVLTSVAELASVIPLVLALRVVPRPPYPSSTALRSPMPPPPPPPPRPCNRSSGGSRK